MFKKIVFIIILFASSLFLASCSNNTNKNHTSEKYESFSNEPTDINIKASLILDIPDATAIQLKIPSKLKGDLEIKAVSEVIANKPLRSHFSGDISIIFSDTVTNQSYLDFQTTIEGNTDGSPNDGIAEAFKRFVNVIMLLSDSSGKFIQQNNRDSEKLPR